MEIFMNVSESVLEVHLSTTHKVSRDNTRWAFPLNENDQPIRAGNNAETKVEMIHEIIDWLDVEDSERYRKGNGSTYCNIYAYDFCYLSQAYIPRVWWSKAVIPLVMSGQDVKPKYATNVFELNANSLFDWFTEYGTDFGWKHSSNLSELQDEANNGKVCIIIAKRKKLNRSGHITIVVPETDVFTAKREHGEVIRPVESQAGSQNYEYIRKNTQWWFKEKFSDYSFYIHE
jgi:hypothetical protein